MMDNEQFDKLERKVNGLGCAVILGLTGNIIMGVIVTIVFFLTVGSMI